ncbi:MAG TPA: hypothetical protein VM283_05150 [Armatimonadota bacterium]|nr:hypothetical protein [Armatimonadota bacterium]
MAPTPTTAPAEATAGVQAAAQPQAEGWDYAEWRRFADVRETVEPSAALFIAPDGAFLTGSPEMQFDAYVVMSDAIEAGHEDLQLPGEVGDFLANTGVTRVRTSAGQVVFESGSFPADAQIPQMVRIVRSAVDASDRPVHVVAEMAVGEKRLKLWEGTVSGDADVAKMVRGLRAQQAPTEGPVAAPQAPLAAPAAPSGAEARPTPAAAPAGAQRGGGPEVAHQQAQARSKEAYDALQPVAAEMRAAFAEHPQGQVWWEAAANESLGDRSAATDRAVELAAQEAPELRPLIERWQAARDAHRAALAVEGETYSAMLDSWKAAEAPPASPAASTSAPEAPSGVEAPPEPAQAPEAAQPALPAPGELVTATLPGGFTRTGRIVAGPDGAPLTQAAADGTEMLAFEETDGRTTFIPPESTFAPEVAGVDLDREQAARTATLQVSPTAVAPDLRAHAPSSSRPAGATRFDLADLARALAANPDDVELEAIYQRQRAAVDEAAEDAVEQVFETHDMVRRMDLAEMARTGFAARTIRLAEQLAHLEELLDERLATLNAYERHFNEIAETQTAQVLAANAEASAAQAELPRGGPSWWERAKSYYPGWRPEDVHLMKNALAGAAENEDVVREAIWRLLRDDEGRLLPVDTRTAIGVWLQMHPHRLRVEVLGSEAGTEIAYPDSVRARVLSTLMGEPVAADVAGRGYAGLSDRVRQAWDSGEAVQRMYSMLYHGGYVRADGTVQELPAIPNIRRMADDTSEMLGGKSVGYVPEYAAKPRLRGVPFEDGKELVGIARAAGMDAETADELVAAAYAVMHPGITQRAAYESAIDPIAALIEKLGAGAVPEASDWAALSNLEPLSAGEWYANQVSRLTLKHGVVALITRQFPTTEEILARLGPEEGAGLLDEMRRQGWEPLNFGGTPMEGLEDRLIPPEYQTVFEQRMLLGLMRSNPALEALVRVGRGPWAWFQSNLLRNRQFLMAQVAEYFMRLGLHGLTPREAAEAEAILVPVLSQMLMEHHALAPYTTFADRMRVTTSASGERLAELMVRQGIATPGEIADYVREFREEGLIRTSMGSSAIDAQRMEGLTHWLEQQKSRMGQVLGISMEEASAVSAGWAELIFGIDNLHRGTAYIALRRRGHSAESARRALREKSAEYGQEASSPIQDLARAFVWYSVFTFQTAQQLAKLAAQRPGVAAAIVEGWRDVPQYQGLDREETEISRATFLGPEWVRVKMSSPVFPDDIKPDPRGVMVQEDGPYFVYMRVRFPVVETAGQVMEMVREPVQS